VLKDNNKSDIIAFELTVNRLKKEIFQSNLIEELKRKYPTKIYK